MSIQDNPLFNKTTNGGRIVAKNNYQKYCNYCGKMLVNSNKDKEGRPDRHKEWRMKNGICIDCFKAGKHMPNHDSSQTERNF